MQPTIEIKLDESKLRSIEAMFRSVPGKLPQIVSRAINRTVTPAKNEIQKGIRQEINIKAADAKDKIYIDKATYDKWVATIALSHSLIPLLDFGARQTKKGVSFKVWKKSGHKFLKHGFIATMASGHRGVFRRAFGMHGEFRWERRNVTTGTRHERKYKKWWNAAEAKFYDTSPRVRNVNWHNVFIGEQFGPSLHDAFQTEQSQDFVSRVIEQAYTRLEHNIDSQVSYVLSQMRTGAAA
jgi:hypothetical protein